MKEMKVKLEKDEVLKKQKIEEEKETKRFHEQLKYGYNYDDQNDRLISRIK